MLTGMTLLIFILIWTYAIDSIVLHSVDDDNDDHNTELPEVGDGIRNSVKGGERANMRRFNGDDDNFLDCPFKWDMRPPIYTTLQV